MISRFNIHDSFVTAERHEQGMWCLWEDVEPELERLRKHSDALGDLLGKAHDKILLAGMKEVKYELEIKRLIKKMEGTDVG